jgi:hypothetical protein
MQPDYTLHKIIGALVFLILGFVALRVIRKRRTKPQPERTRVEPISPRLVAVARILSIYLVLPYWVTLALIGPWRKNAHFRAFARKALAPFFWLDALWVTLPVIVGIYLVYGEVSWGPVVALYVVTALLLHSAIAHSAAGFLASWEDAHEIR